jgi:ATP-dependent DNA helicase RecQ
VVFSDATLAEMARTMPTGTQQFRQISGVGEHKLREYGKAFIEAITAYVANSGAAAFNLTDKDL